MVSFRKGKGARRLRPGNCGAELGPNGDRVRRSGSMKFAAACNRLNGALGQVYRKGRPKSARCPKEGELPSVKH